MTDNCSNFSPIFNQKRYFLLRHLVDLAVDNWDRIFLVNATRRAGSSSRPAYKNRRMVDRASQFDQ